MLKSLLLSCLAVCQPRQRIQHSGQRLWPELLPSLPPVLCAPSSGAGSWWNCSKDERRIFPGHPARSPGLGSASCHYRSSTLPGAWRGPRGSPAPVGDPALPSSLTVPPTAGVSPAVPPTSRGDSTGHQPRVHSSGGGTWRVTRTQIPQRDMEASAGWHRPRGWAWVLSENRPRVAGS